MMTEITAVWLRRIGENVEVLIERDHQWWLVIRERHDGSFSHIAEESKLENPYHG